MLRGARAVPPASCKSACSGEGQRCAAGQALFAIDAAPYQATLQSAQASVARAESNLAQATAQADRLAAGRGQRDQQAGLRERRRRPAFRAGRCRAAARAAVTTANINLGYASVTAPISGRIGRALSPKVLVGKAKQRSSPSFSRSTRCTSTLRSPPPSDEAAQRNGGGSKWLQCLGPTPRVSSWCSKTAASTRNRQVVLRSHGGSTTGQITLRAEVPNPDGQLRRDNLCASASNRRRQQCHHGAAAGGHAHQSGRQRDGGRRRQQAGRAAHRQGRRRQATISGSC